MNITLLAENIKRLKVKKGYSSYKIAKLSGVAESTLSLIENGKRKNVTMETVQKIASALNVSTEELVACSEEEEYEVSDIYDLIDVIFQASDLILNNQKLSSIEKKYLKNSFYESLDNLIMTRKIFSDVNFDMTSIKNYQDFVLERSLILREKTKN